MAYVDSSAPTASVLRLGVLVQLPARRVGGAATAELAKLAERL
ncbi:MAG TPA: hypothetical protein VGJ59_14230 [Jatrophihabitantaceae bacterium]|jgi:hypothetical protein